MKSFDTYTCASYNGTTCLNPDAPWQDRITGNYEPTISIHEINDDLKDVILSALRAAARKESDDMKAAEMLTLCVKITESWHEAVRRAAERDKEAFEKLEAWKAQNGESEVASC